MILPGDIPQWFQNVVFLMLQFCIEKIYPKKLKTHKDSLPKSVTCLYIIRENPNKSTKLQIC